MPVEELRLSSPPVRHVRLALYIAPDRAIEVAHLDGLWARWRSDFTRVNQAPPLLDGYGPTVANDESQEWPLPLLQFESEQGDSAIVFQGDRFAVQWSFNSESTLYPTFDTLAPALIERFRQFLEVLDSNGYTDEVPVIKVEATYVNSVGPVGFGRHLSDTLFRSAEGRNVMLADDVPKEGTRSFTVHAHEAGVMYWVTIGSQGEPDVDLVIRVSQDVTEVDSWERALENAHEVERRLFLRYTTKEQLEGWR